jgi:hypothetical protein
LLLNLRKQLLYSITLPHYYEYIPVLVIVACYTAVTQSSVINPIAHTSRYCNVHLYACYMCVCIAGKTVGGVASSAGTNRAHFAVKESPEAAFVHPSSVNAERFRNASEKGQKPVWILYHTKVKTKQVVY